MPTMCIHCAIKALLNDEKPISFDESPEEHEARVHPDLVATQQERRELEAKLATKLGVETSEKL